MASQDEGGRGQPEMFSTIADFGRAIGPRLGCIVADHTKIHTPHYLAITSRGVVPHLSQDTFVRDTHLQGVYVALEDFIEKYPHDVPLYKFKPKDGSSPLRRFTALPDESLLVLGARRAPPVAAPAANSNTNTSVAVCTAVGFKHLLAKDYATASEEMHADIVVGLGDIPYGRALVPKRMEKAVDRQIDWMQHHIKSRNALPSRSKLFAPILPVSCEKQRFYMDWLDEEAKGVSGLALYSVDSLQDLPDTLASLPRLGFTTPSTPHEVLRHVSSGLDIMTIPFIGAATDAGIALDFAFPPTTDEDLAERLSLGVDMWTSDHATDVSPLGKDCTCYACTNHHRAFLQHLLAAKEMTGWVLLQIHNHHVIDQFFAGVRKSIAEQTLDRDMEHFGRIYQSELPEKTGRGPRVRGYQFKSEGPSEPKKNISNFTAFNDKQAQLAEDTRPSGNAELPDEHTDAAELEGKGFAKAE